MFLKFQLFKFSV